MPFPPSTPQKAREGGRTINVHALIAAGVNADGHAVLLGLAADLGVRLLTCSLA
ncbi:hypothetical protein [Streptomyces sp. NPDC001292]|uniref:hypothetical protein n=1 Tax=Streptomyces sp. NPDC001292 TaxID=3364558 RepID=UPI0036BB8B9A